MTRSRTTADAATKAVRNSVLIAHAAMAASNES